MFRLLVIVFLLIPSISQSQRSIGKVEKQKKAQIDTTDIPIIDWAGERFIFLEKTKQFQKFGGYSSFLDKKAKSYMKAFIGKIDYNKYVGKVVTVEKVIHESGGELITMRVDKTGDYISAASYHGYVEGIALFKDLEKAKQAFIGDTVYVKKGYYHTYDEVSDKFGQFKVNFTEPLIVLDVWWGVTNVYGPLWLIVELKDGQKGFIPFKFSWTNYYKDRWEEYPPWEDVMFDFNPIERYGWSEEICKTILENKIQIGMNKEQVKLSWRKPDKINKTLSAGVRHEQWIYSDGQYIYFENGVVTTIQQ